MSRARHSNQPDAARFSGEHFCRTVAFCCAFGGVFVWMAASWANAASHGPAGVPVSLQLRQPRVVVLKSARKVHLFDGDTLMRTFSITLGPEPAGQKRRAGDGRTPEGRYRICSKNRASPNHRFLGISYPDRAAARRGLADGLISAGEAAAIHQAQERGKCPSWTTALGGGIGFHGGAGAGTETAGCIGLRDEHVTVLFNVLRIGDEVEILP